MSENPLDGPEPPRAWPTGTHTIRVTSPGGDWPADALQFEEWSLAFLPEDERAELEESLGECPIVAHVEAVGDDLAELLLHLDAAMVTGIAYVLEGPNTTEFLLEEASITGPRRNLAIGGAAEAADLLDIDAPVLAGSAFTLDETRDWSLSSGVATVEKVMWTRLLEAESARYWRPDLGGAFTLKALRPVDVRDAQKRAEARLQGIPHVSAVQVQLTWNPGGMMVVTVRAQTDFGRVETERTVTQGA